PLQLVELAQRRMKHMHHDVHIVEQRPTSLLQSLFVMHSRAFLPELLHDMLCDGANMGVGIAGRNYEEIGHVGNAGEVEYNHIGSLQFQAEFSGAPGECFGGCWGLRGGHSAEREVNSAGSECRVSR